MWDLTCGAQRYCRGPINSRGWRKVVVHIERRYIIVAMVAMFIFGSITTMFASSGEEKCDWTRSASTDIFREDQDGDATAEAALSELTVHSEELNVPVEAIANRSGNDYFKEREVSEEGHVAYGVYVDGIERINATVTKFGDGTYGLTSFTTCLGV